MVVVANLRLASLVQYLPMSVVGGYLAFIGFFCGEVSDNSSDPLPQTLPLTSTPIT